jgi:hypothetical protein
MKFNLGSGSPWHDFSRLVLNARSIEIDGYTGDVDVENVDGHLTITRVKAEKAEKPKLKAVLGGKK